MPRPPRSRARTEHTFQRAYKACIPCQRRKAKCELPGPLRNGGHRGVEQPCNRCRRMRIQCAYSGKQPWSRRNAGLGTGTGVQTGTGSEDGLLEGVNEEDTRTPAVPMNERQELSPASSTSTSIGLEDGGCISTTVLQKQVASGNDALDILFDAAAQNQTALGPRLNPRLQACVSGDGDAAAIRSDARQIWEGCRFVKMGWFTAEEALIYVDWFFTNLSPTTTPILTPFFASHATHYWLITQEPVLCCTILMISARYHTLPGPSGSSRGFYIHNRLWQHCQHLILRIMLGQEKLSKAKTRHISTIEALLLLSEWYPLALHFPGESDGWDSDWMLTAQTARDPPAASKDCPMQDGWKEDVVEPTRRADRMAWMLVSSTLGLAHELGVFNSKESTRESGMAGPDVGAYLLELEIRRLRLPSLLFVTTNLLASRIGCTSIMPELSKQENLDQLMVVDPDWTRCMTSWVGLTLLTKDLRERFFSGSQHIDFEALEQWKGQLAAWKDSHQSIGNFHYENILHLEYQYLRVFANSLGVQGIVERVLTDMPPQSQSTIAATFVSQARELKMSRAEYEHIEEVIDGACAILSRISSRSDPRCLPMRVLSRIISSSIFLLKALALGVRRTKLQESLRLLDATIATLLANSLDDIHLVSRYATLLKVHVSRLRGTFASSEKVIIPKPTQSNEAEPPQAESEGHLPDNWSNLDLDLDIDLDFSDWLSLPLDPLMAPFGSGSLDGVPDGLDSDCLDLDFIWNLPS